MIPKRPIMYYDEDADALRQYAGTPDELGRAIAPARCKIAELYQEAKRTQERLNNVSGINLAALEAKLRAEAILEVLRAVDLLPLELVGCP